MATLAPTVMKPEASSFDDVASLRGEHTVNKESMASEPSSRNATRDKLHVDEGSQDHDQ